MGGSQMFRQKKNDPLQSALTAGPITPSNNTGYAGEVANLPPVQPPPSAPAAPTSVFQPPAPVGAPRPSANTRLMEGDQKKLANLDHAKKSPKYDFLQLAQQNKYGYDQLGEMLKELQGGPNASHWQGWTADRDKLKYTGDPSQLGSQWGGVTTVDTIGGFNSGNPQGFRWGADDAGTLGQAQAPGLFDANSLFTNPNVSPADLPQDAEGANSILQQILAQLNGDPAMKKALRY